MQQHHTADKRWLTLRLTMIHNIRINYQPTNFALEFHIENANLISEKYFFYFPEISKESDGLSSGFQDQNRLKRQFGVEGTLAALYGSDPFASTSFSIQPDLCRPGTPHHASFSRTSSPYRCRHVWRC